MYKSRSINTNFYTAYDVLLNDFYNDISLDIRLTREILLLPCYVLRSIDIARVIILFCRPR